MASESREFKGVLPHLQQARRLNWPVQYSVAGELAGTQVALLAHGPGPVLAGKAVAVAREKTRVEAMISTGFCGALDPALEVGSIFVASEILDETGKLRAKAEVPVTRSGFAGACGSLLSLDRVAGTPAEKRSLRQTGAAAVEMEAAAVASGALAAGVPFYCVRVVTDSAAEGFGIDFNAVRDRDGRFSRAKIVGMACRSPFKLIPELLRLDQRSRAAALVLGEFIADCQF